MESSGALKQGGHWRPLLSVYQAAGLIDGRRAERLIEIVATAARVNAALLENQNLSGPTCAGLYCDSIRKSAGILIMLPLMFNGR